MNISIITPVHNGGEAFRRFHRRGPAVSLIGVLVLVCSPLAMTGCRAPAAQNTAPVDVIHIDDGRVPDAEIDGQGTIHVAYLSGKDVFYMFSEDDAASFSEPVRINSEPGFATGGLYRGPDIAVTSSGDVHVVWYNDAHAQSRDDQEHGVMYARLDADRGVFENSRNLSSTPSDNYSISVSDDGVVSVLWTAGPLYMLTSTDGGDTFSDPVELQSEPCECCGTRSVRTTEGKLYYLYRDRRENFRDMYLAVSVDSASRFSRIRLNDERWQLNACPMSSSYVGIEGDVIHAAWESVGEIYYGRHDRYSGAQLTDDALVSSSGKYPVVLFSDDEVLVSWKDGSRLFWSTIGADAARADAASFVRSDNRDRGAGVATAAGKFVLFD